MNSRQLLSILAGPVAFLLILLTGPYGAMTPQALAVLASTSWIAIWWISEAIPIAATSLLPIILFPLTGALNIEAATAPYGDKIVFLYIGGFMIATAIERWNLHKRIALTVILFIGTNLRRMVLGFMIATAFLSMWISNTATSVMMLPIGLAMIRQMEVSVSEKSYTSLSKALMLGIAYSASIGGISTLIGTPPNLVFVGVVQEYYGLEIDFSSWMLLVFPLAIILLGISWFYLTYMAFPFDHEKVSGGVREVREELKKLGVISLEEKMVLTVFAGTGALWITRSFLLAPFLPAVNDTIIGIFGALLLFILPARRGHRILDWGQAVKIPWGIVLLFGGGLAIAEGFRESGLATWIGQRMSGLQGMELIVLLFVVVGLVNFLTEITSNVATISMILPILAPLSETLHVHPYMLMVGATLAASCAFMLPVATPPNAVVFGSGYLRMKDMMKTGFVLNVISILLVTLYLYFLLPLVWELG